MEDLPMRLRPLFTFAALAAVLSLSISTTSVVLADSIASAKAVEAQVKEAATNVGLQEVLPLSVATRAPFAWDKLLPTWSGLLPSAFADEAPLPPGLQVPDQDLGASIGQLLNYKALGAIGVGMVVIVILMQLLKKVVGEFKYKRLVVTGLAVVYAVLLALTAGVGIGPAIVAVLFTGGGASSLYEALKGAGIVGSSA
jgi:hypothetical protein